MPMVSRPVSDLINDKGRPVTVNLFYCRACGSESFRIIKGDKDSVPHFLCTGCPGIFCGTFDGTHCPEHV